VTSAFLLTAGEPHLPAVCPMCGAPADPRMMVAHVQAVVAAYFEMPIAEMYSARRCWAYSHPRQIAMFLSRELTPKSLPDIGRRFGNRDHTTVMHAIRAVRNRMESDREVALDVEVLRERLAG
jgi:chromosomal replication initiator protein